MEKRIVRIEYNVVTQADGAPRMLSIDEPEVEDQEIEMVAMLSEGNPVVIFEDAEGNCPVNGEPVFYSVAAIYTDEPLGECINLLSRLLIEKADAEKKEPALFEIIVEDDSEEGYASKLVICPKNRIQDLIVVLNLNVVNCEEVEAEEVEDGDLDLIVKESFFTSDDE